MCRLDIELKSGHFLLHHLIHMCFMTHALMCYHSFIYMYMYIYIYQERERERTREGERVGGRERQTDRLMYTYTQICTYIFMRIYLHIYT